MGRVISEARSGRDGLEPLMDGFLIVFAGLLLVLPGFLSDFVGVILLLPPVRRLLTSAGLSRMLAGAVVHTEMHEQRYDARASRSDSRREPSVIEVDYERLDDQEAGGKPDAEQRRRSQ